MLHRQLWRLSLAAAFIVSCVIARADKPAGPYTPDLRQKVERLLADLDAESRSVRTAARAILLDLGPAILPLLPEERTLPNADTRESVAQIRTRLERQSALDTLAASHVTLHGRFPPREVLRRITEQTGNHFDSAEIDPAHLNQELTVNDESRSFWSTCDDVCQKAGLAYAPVHGAGRLGLLSSAKMHFERELAVAESGPFRVAILSVELRPALGESRNFLRINWSLMAEPRLRPLFASIAANRLVASSGDTRFKPATPTAKWELSLGEGSQSLRLAADFEIPAGAHPASVDFNGSLGVEMAAGPHAFVFDDLTSAAGEKRRAGSVTVGLRSVEFPPPGESRGAARIEITLVYDQGGPAFESYRTWMYHNEATLETRNGKRLAPRPVVSTQQQGDGSVAVEYNFANVEGIPRDYRFVYVAPTLITQVPVEFRFPKIPVARAALGGTTR
jgi:hypothetical protein